jgi:hypothetical protein
MFITNAKTATYGHHTPTPGPWHTQGRYIVPADNGPSIGSAVALKAPSLKKQPDFDAQAMVNARLMAAAPDMLHLLYKVLPIIEDAREDPCYKPKYVASVESAILELMSMLERPL